MIFFSFFLILGKQNILLGFENCCLEYFLGTSVVSLIIPKLWGQITFFFYVLPCLTTYALMLLPHINLINWLIYTFKVYPNDFRIFTSCKIYYGIISDEGWHCFSRYLKISDFLQNQVLVTVIQKRAFFFMKKGLISCSWTSGNFI